VNGRNRKRRPCAACGKLVGAATIVAGGPYGDAPICAACGPSGPLTCDEVWTMIATRRGEPPPPKTGL